MASKREERARFKEEAAKKYDLLNELPYPSKEYDALWEEIQRDEMKLKKMSREATMEWLEEIREK